MRLRGAVSGGAAIAAAMAMSLAPVAPLPAGASSRAEGSYDTAFGAHGVLTDWNGGASSVTQDKAGRSLAVSTDRSQHLYVSRYRTDGSVDTAFGNQGVASLEFPVSGGVDAGGIAVGPDGRILITGRYAHSGAATSIVVARFTAAGDLDTSFDVKGYALVDFGTSVVPWARGLAVQPDGKAVVVGTTGGSDGLAMRFTTNGDLDLGWAGGGIATVNLNQYTRLNAVTILPDGRVLAVGSEYLNGYSGFGLVRWTSAGELDTTFNGSGTQSTLVGSATLDNAYGVALEPDGHFLVAGEATWGNQDEVVVRYTSDGQVDTSWAQSGHQAFDYGTTEEFDNVALQRDGKIVLLGDTVDTYNSYLTVVRLTPDGSFDGSFDSDGWRAFYFGSGILPAGLGVDRSGRILAGATAAAATVVMALVGDGTPPLAANASALPRYSLGSSATLRWNAASDDNTGVRSYNVLTQSMRYDATGPGPAGVYKTGLTSRKTPVARKAGFTRCFVVEARDYAGNVGVPGNQVCTAFPVDDRTLGHSGSWTSGKGKAYYLGTFRRSTSAGAALSLKVAYRHLALVATTCPTCGTVKVYLGKTLLLKKSLHASKAHNQVVIPIASSSNIRRGTLRIVQSSAGKAVTIDGLVVSQV